MRSNYNNEIYKMYEEEVNKNKEANKKIKDLELEVYVLKSNLKISENKINTEVEKAVKPILEENENLKNELNKTYEEINRLKKTNK